VSALVAGMFAGRSGATAAPGPVLPGPEAIAVVERRSETEQVFANPDGTFSASITSRPVRVHRPDGSWVRRRPHVAGRS
jgi:hypothetical protein